MLKGKNLVLCSLILAASLSIIATNTIGQELTYDADTNQNNNVCKNGSYSLGSLNFCFAGNMQNQSNLKKFTKNICTDLWQVMDTSGNCVPKYSMEVCGAPDFSCSGGRLGDLFKLTEDRLICKDGEIVIIRLPTKNFSEGGIDDFALILIEVYACLPINKLPPNAN